MSRPLTLKLLGPFTASYGGAPLASFRTKAVQALLVYLACQPEIHRRDSLMALLWPDVTLSSAQNSLRQALYYLRKAVPEVTNREGGDPVPFVLSDRQMVRVNPQASFDLDVALFEKQLKGPEVAWQEAIALYRGEFLCDFYLPDSSHFEAWVLERRADLRRLVMDALDLLIASQMEQDAYELAEEFARRQLAIDNLHELAHQRLMEILVHVGRRTEALAHYESYRALLDDELGVEPVPECVEFIREVRGGASLPPTPALPARPVRRHNLRPQPRRLIGREQELHELRGLVEGSHRRLITLVGPGGIGKSRLAMAFAARQVEEKGAAGRLRFADGVFLVPLQPLRDKGEIIVAIAKALDLPLEGGERRSLQQQLLDFLREKQLLLILDSFEHLLNETGLLTEMLAVAPGLRLLVTSRQRLRLYGEQVYPVLGLAFPDEIGGWESEDPTGYASVALFIDCARRVLPGYAPPLEEAYQIAELCRLVSGMPLTLELAASWVDVLPVSRIVDEIRRNLDFLSADLRDLPERHRSMRAVFDHTWTQLARVEQAALAQLSVFRGDFSARAAKAVCGTNRETLTSLVRKSVLQYDRQDGRYQIHELLRQYGECRLSAQKRSDGEKPPECIVRQRHSAYYCRALAEWEKGLKSERQREVLGEVVTEWDNIRAAWEWAVANREVTLLGQAAEGLAVSIRCQGHHVFGEDLFGAAVRLLREMLASAAQPATSEQLLYGRLLMWNANFCDDYGDQGRRERLAEESLTILEELQTHHIDTRLERAKLWQVMFTNHQNAWRHAEALQAAENSLALSRAVEDDWSVAGALEALGSSAWFFGRCEQAREWLESSLALQRKLGNRDGQARALQWLADIAGSQGQFARDERLMRASLAINEELGNQRAAAAVLGKLASDLTVQGRFGEAVPQYTEAITRSRHLGIDSLVAFQLGGLASAKEALGVYDEAASLAQEALTLIRGQNVTLVRSLALRILSTVAIVEKRYGDASNLLQERQELLIDSPRGQQIGLACRSYVATANQDYALSARLLEAALRGGDQAAASLLWTLAAGALLLARQGAICQALAVYAGARREPFVGNSCWFDDVVGAPLRELARTLPAAAIQEAEEQGQGWDIWETGQRLLEALEGCVSEDGPVRSLGT